MKRTSIMAMAAIIAGLAVPALLSAQASSVERGQALFENPRAFGGQKSCSACHPGGRGLEKAGGKSRFNIMGKVQNSLPEAVNFCIVNANRGKAIPVDSVEMGEITAYIKSLAGKPATPGYGKPAPGYGKPAPGYGAPAPGYGGPK